MLAAPTSPIDASKFVAYVSERRKKRILFKGEFLIIQRSIDLQKCTTEIGMLFPSQSHVLLLKMLNLFVEIPHFCNCMLRILYTYIVFRHSDGQQKPIPRYLAIRSQSSGSSAPTRNRRLSLHQRKLHSELVSRKGLHCHTVCKIETGFQRSLVKFQA